MKKTILLFALLISTLSYLRAQQDVGTIRGKVIDEQNEQTLLGATIIVTTTTPVLSAITDAKGEFVIDNVPLGRQDLKITFIGYLTQEMHNILINKGKDIIIEVKIQQSAIEIGQITVKSDKKKLDPQNEMATVSARSFTIVETERYAGSRGDVSRMATNYAGVMVANDQRNDIIIRGNSPSGLLWRMNGIDIPNPNHFGGLGTTGGPVCMLNNNVLSNSDFFTAAFPAEYGNALSGVFDLNMRSGNNKKYEFLGQVGFNGFEIGAEGPISKKQGSSFLANFRYSTL